MEIRDNLDKENVIRNLKIERMKLLEEYGYDRTNTKLIKREREILLEIEKLSNEK